MYSGLKTLCFNIWKSKYERKGIQESFKPEFSRYIGVENESEYANILKTIVEKSNQYLYSIIFDGSIPLQAEFDIITYVGSELQTMNVRDLKNADIVLFDDQELNKIFLSSLDFVVNLALSQETFYNESSRNDFIIKLIVWTYSYIRPISHSFETSYSPKCFYYGDITKHEIYFLMMLHLMTFDVVYINPLREEFWDQVDKSSISEIKRFQRILPVETLAKKIQDAIVLNLEESITLSLQSEIDNALFTNSGIYRPWQFKDYKVKSRFIQSTLIDLENNYQEPAKLRNGFAVEENSVIIPNYLFQIDGVYNNKSDFSKLVNLCISTLNTLVLTDRGESLIERSVSEDDKLKLVFCKINDVCFNIDELKNLPFYCWAKYRDSLEDTILNSINRLFEDCIYKEKISQQTQFDIVADILSMNQKIVKMMDNFDYPDKVPKIVIFLENEDFVSERILRLLGFIHKLGFDIVIFNPSGLLSIDIVFNPSRFTIQRLDTMKYDCTLENVKKDSPVTKGGFFSKLFN